MSKNTKSEKLTERQREVLRLVSRGLTNKAIAESLGIKEGTVGGHLRLIMARLNAQNRAQASMKYFCK